MTSMTVTPSDCRLFGSAMNRNLFLLEAFWKLMAFNPCFSDVIRSWSRGWCTPPQLSGLNTIHVDVKPMRSLKHNCETFALFFLQYLSFCLKLTWCEIWEKMWCAVQLWSLHRRMEVRRMEVRRSIQMASVATEEAPLARLSTQAQHPNRLLQDAVPDATLANEHHAHECCWPFHCVAWVLLAILLIRHQ